MEQTLIKEEQKKKKKWNWKKFPLVVLITQLIRTVNQLFKTVFNVLILLLQPIKFLVSIVQFLKARGFSIILLAFTGTMVYFATIAYLPVVLKTFYPLLTDEAARQRAVVIAVSSELSLVYLEINRKRKWGAVVMIAIMALNIVGLSVDILNNQHQLTDLQLYGQLAFGFFSTSLTLILMYNASREASKIAKNASWDRALTGRRTKKSTRLSKGDRLILLNQMCEHVDHQYQTNPTELSFHSVYKTFSDRINNPDFVSRNLKKLRPDVYQYIKDNSKKGRKSIIVEESKPKASRKEAFFNFLSGLGIVKKESENV